VVACPDCESAREAAEETGPFALVLTDLNLPDGNGMDLITELRLEQPQLPGMLITGDSDALKSTRGNQKLRILEKPLAPARLHTAIRQIMGAA